jgi:hypothetical protein
MKGLEESIEYQEQIIELQKKVVLHLSSIVISSVLLTKDIIDFLKLNEKNNN